MCNCGQCSEAKIRLTFSQYCNIYRTLNSSKSVPKTTCAVLKGKKAFGIRRLFSLRSPATAAGILAGRLGHPSDPARPQLDALWSTMSFHPLRECFSTAPRGHPSARQADGRKSNGGVVVGVVLLLGRVRLAYIVYSRWQSTPVAVSTGRRNKKKTAVDAGI